MAKSKLINCKACGAEIARSAKHCPNCGAKNKKPVYKRWWFWAAIIVVLIIIVSSVNGDDNGEAANGNVNSNEVVSSENNVNNTKVEAANVKKEYYIGDTIEDGNKKITFISSGDYVEENEFMQPSDGNKYIFLQFAFENTSSSSDTSISFYSFDCYADGYAADMYYAGDDTLSATLSAGRATTGYIYFEVPIDAESIEVEYETNAFTEKKIKFIFEGDKNSGYVQEKNTTPSPDAHSVGDVVESSNLKITYISCEEYISDNMFVTPNEGYHFISCEFEFENVGSSDEYISSFSFDCYADGLDCDGEYIRDDDLSATISAGRKVKGTVTFEVPIDAEVIEVEFLSNYWTSNRVVFTVE